MTNKPPSKYKKFFVLLLICAICIVCIILNWQKKISLDQPNFLVNLKNIYSKNNFFSNNKISAQDSLEQNSQIDFLSKDPLPNNSPSYGSETAPIKFNELEIQKQQAANDDLVKLRHKAIWYKTQFKGLVKLNNLVLKYRSNLEMGEEIDYFLKYELPVDIKETLTKLKLSNQKIGTNLSFQSELIFPKSNSFLTRFLTIRKTESKKENFDTEVNLCFNSLLEIFSSTFTDKD